MQINSDPENSELAGLAEVEKRRLEIENIERISSRLRPLQHLRKIDKTNFVRDCANKNFAIRAKPLWQAHLKRTAPAQRKTHGGRVQSIPSQNVRKNSHQKQHHRWWQTRDKPHNLRQSERSPRRMGSYRRGVLYCRLAQRKRPIALTRAYSRSLPPQ